MSYQHGQHARFAALDAGIRGIRRAGGADGVSDVHIVVVNETEFIGSIKELMDVTAKGRTSTTALSIYWDNTVDCGY